MAIFALLSLRPALAQSISITGDVNPSPANSPTWAISGTLQIGVSGSGSLEIDGGLVSDTDADLGLGGAGSATITSGTWQNSANLIVADSSDATLDISGGLITSQVGIVGLESTGVVTLSSGTWQNSTVFDVGYDNVGTLDLEGGLLINNGTASIGHGGFGGQGTVIVNSGTWQNPGTLLVGEQGTGTLSIGGGVVSTGTTNIGSEIGSAGMAVVTAGVWKNTGVLNIGNSGSGTLEIDGGFVSSATSIVGTNTTSQGTVTVTGGTFQNSTLIVGNQGNGALNINGGLVTSTTAFVGAGPDHLGAVTVTSGTWQNSGDIFLGSAFLSDGELMVSGGLVSADEIVVSSGSFSSGILDINGGEVDSNEVLIGNGPTANGTLILSGSAGGVLATGQIVKGSGTFSFLTFDGGVLRATMTQSDLLSGFSPGDVTINPGGALIDSNGFQIGIATVLSGSGGLTKLGSGTLTLTGSNSYAGTTIQEGTLMIGNGGTTGTLGSGDVVDDGLLNFNRSDDVTITNAISGTGSVQQTSASMLTLSGSNSYSGGTIITSGTVSISGDTGLGNGSGTLTMAGGSLRTTGNVFTNESVVLATDGTFDLTSETFLTFNNTVSGTGGLTKIGSGFLSLDGDQTYTGSTTVVGGFFKVEGGSLASPVVNLSSATFYLADGTGNYAGNITGSGTFDRGGAGSNTLTGTVSVGVATVIDSGTLQIGNGGTTGAILSDIADAGTLALDRSDTVIQSSNISGSGGIDQRGSGTFILTGSNTYSGPTIIEAGTLMIGNGGATGSLGTGTVADGSVLNFNHGDALTVANVISGIGSVQQIGVGTLTLSGSNTYSGGTTLTNGTVNFSNDANLGDLSGTVTLNGGVLHNTSDVITSRNFILGAHGGTFLNDVGFLTINGTISGPGSLTKNGSNILTLLGNQTYTGPTTINAGMFKLQDATLASSSLNLGAGTQTFLTGSSSLAGPINGSGNVLVQDGTVTLSGPGGSIYSGTMTVSRAELIVAAPASQSIGTLLVSSTTGEQASFLLNGGSVMSGSAAIGSNGGSGTFDVSSGTWSSNVLDVGDNSTGAVNQTGGSVATSSLTVGQNSGTGTLNLTGGILSVGFGLGTLNLAATAGSVGTLNIGTGATAGTLLAGSVTAGGGAATVNFNQTGTVTFGALFSGAMTVNNIGPGTTIFASTNRLGAAANNLSVHQGTVIYSGSNQTFSDLAVSGSAGDHGSFVMQAGNFGDTTVEIAAGMGSSGTVTETGGNWTAASQMIVGESGTGVFQINGGSFDTRTLVLGQDEGSAGTLAMTSGGLTVEIQTIVGESGTGILNLTGVSANTAGLILGANAGSLGVANLSGGTWSDNSSTPLAIGQNGVGSLTISSGTFIKSSFDTSIGQFGGSGTLTLNAGALYEAGGDSKIGYAGTGVLNLEGGVYSGIGGQILVGSTGTGTMNVDSGTFDGGISAINLGFIAGSRGTINIGTGSSSGTVLANAIIGGAGTAIVNFNHTDALTFDVPLTGTLAVNQLASGTTTLDDPSSYTGTTTVSAGQLTVNNDSALGVSKVHVNGGVLLIDAGVTISNTVTLAGGRYDRALGAGADLMNAVNASSAFTDGRGATAAALLGGTLTVSGTLQSSFLRGDSRVLSDIYMLGNMPATDGKTDTFVLQLTIGSVQEGDYLGWLDSDGNWVNAVLGNIGGVANYVGDQAYDPSDFVLGDYGIDTATGSVWAVLDHNSEFAVAPEPSAGLLLILAAGLFGAKQLRTHSRKFTRIP